MSKNPILNGSAAFGYIMFIVAIMTLGSQIFPRQDSLIAPLAVICLFTLSAAVMGYIFVLEPAQLYLDGKRKEAVRLFLQTVFVFAGFTAVVFALLYSKVLPF